MPLTHEQKVQIAVAYFFRGRQWVMFEQTPDERRQAWLENQASLFGNEAAERAMALRDGIHPSGFFIEAQDEVQLERKVYRAARRAAHFGRLALAGKPANTVDARLVAARQLLRTESAVNLRLVKELKEAYAKLDSGVNGTTIWALQTELEKSRTNVTHLRNEVEGLKDENEGLVEENRDKLQRLIELGTENRHLRHDLNVWSKDKESAMSNTIEGLSGRLEESAKLVDYWKTLASRRGERLNFYVAERETLVEKGDALASERGQRIWELEEELRKLTYRAQIVKKNVVEEVNKL